MFYVNFRSGTEEVYTEKDILLQEISDLCSEFHLTPTKKTKVISKEKQIAEIGKQARERNALDLLNIYEKPSEEPKDPVLMEHDYFGM